MGLFRVGIFPGGIFLKQMKICTTITDLEFSMSFANLFIGLLVQRLLVFLSKGALLHITCHHFGHLKLLYRSFLLIENNHLIDK